MEFGLQTKNPLLHRMDLEDLIVSFQTAKFRAILTLSINNKTCVNYAKFYRLFPFLRSSSRSRYSNAINSEFDNSVSVDPSTSVSPGWKELALKFMSSLSASIKQRVRCFTLNTSEVFK